MRIQVRARDKDPLAEFLGWFSIGLGTAQIAAPRMLCKLIGADGDGVAPKVMRLMGARELAQGTGILVRPRPTMWLWSRVAGDGLDLSLLGLIAIQESPRADGVRDRERAAVTVAGRLREPFLTPEAGPGRVGEADPQGVTIPASGRGRARMARAELRGKVERGRRHR